MPWLLARQTCLPVGSGSLNSHDYLGLHRTGVPLGAGPPPLLMVSGPQLQRQGTVGTFPCGALSLSPQLSWLFGFGCFFLVAAASRASEKVSTSRRENDALYFVSITLMVIHFASHMLGRLEDDKLTMTPLGHC